MPEAVRAGHSIHWITGGRGTDPALLIHCGLGRARAWAGVMEVLAPRLSMTAYDLPGHGRSNPWDRAGNYLSTCIAVGETFAERPTHIIGHSFGAVTALGVALARPENALSLTLIEPVLFAAAKTSQPGAFADYLERMAPYAKAVAAGNGEAATRAFSHVWGGATWADTPGPQRRYLTERIYTIEDSVPGLIDDAAGILASGRIEALTVPVHLIRGVESPAIVPAIHEALCARLPKARETVISGAAHMVPITHPREAAAAIKEGLSRAEA
ncbi:MAG: alpha/beta hydrolase [Pseudomonadota bacterium]